MYRLLCLDIDGTLLNSRHEITPRVKTAIGKMARQNCLVVLVSARMPKGIRFLQQELGLQAPIICYSGALVLDEQERTIWQANIAVPDAAAIWNNAREQQIHVSLYRDDTWYIAEHDHWSAQESDITHIEPCCVDYTSLFARWQADGTGPNKMLCLADPEKLSRFEASLASGLTIYRSKTTYLEVGSPQASKTAAIRLLAARNGIRTGEIMCIGDNYNDIDMLQYAGLGIAMGNAPEPVKRQADAVTAGNDEDGVAAAIEKYCFGKGPFMV